MTLGIVIVSTASSVAMLFIGYTLGRMYTQGVKPKPAAPPKPICMCDHNYGSHEEGRRCKVAIFDDYYGRKIGNCACLLYVGPDPILSGLWHPPAKDKDS